jgi:hypothetical protein
MIINDDGFPAHWKAEKEWLIELVSLPESEGEENNLVTLNWVGRLAAFAFYTNVRILAQVGDPDLPTYELWFSFPDDVAKQQFLDLVREDAYADPEEEGSFVAPQPESFQELENLRPIASVFPKEHADLITGVAKVTLVALETNSKSSNA